MFVNEIDEALNESVNAGHDWKKLATASALPQEAEAPMLIIAQQRLALPSVKGPLASVSSLWHATTALSSGKHVLASKARTRGVDSANATARTVTSLTCVVVHDTEYISRHKVECT